MPLPIHHRMAMPIRWGRPWHGPFGASSRFHGKLTMTEAVGNGQSLLSIDRGMMSYVHNTKIRHRQLRASYSHTSGNTERIRVLDSFFSRRRQRKLHLGFRAFMHFKTKCLLEEQAALVTTYSQSAVNYVLGDSSLENDEIQKKLAVIQRRIQTPDLQLPVPRLVVTPRQRHPDRFDRRQRVT
jgi:hypothetical protein